MGALALGKVPYDRWVKYVWKLMLYFFLLNMLFLIAGGTVGMTQPGRPLDAAVPVFIIGVNIHLNIHWRKLLFRKNPR